MNIKPFEKSRCAKSFSLAHTPLQFPQSRTVLGDRDGVVGDLLPEASKFVNADEDSIYFGKSTWKVEFSRDALKFCAINEKAVEQWPFGLFKHLDESREDEKRSRWSSFRIRAMRAFMRTALPSRPTLKKQFEMSYA